MSANPNELTASAPTPAVDPHTTRTIATHDLPPVKTIMNALLWLSARHREAPCRETHHAMACQAQWLALHPDASLENLIVGFRLAGICYHDALLWMNAHLGNAVATRH